MLVPKVEVQWGGNGEPADFLHFPLSAIAAERPCSIARGGPGGRCSW